MRLKQYITEKTDTKLLVRKIKKDCKQIIKEYKKAGAPLWRGVATLDRQYVLQKKMYKKSRKPKDTPQELHDWMNKYFTKTMGWPVRNGISTTPAIGQAMDYGSPFAFFPKDKYKFAWHPNIYDLTNHAPIMEDVGIQDKDFGKFLDLVASGEEDLSKYPKSDMMHPSAYSKSTIINDWKDFIEDLKGFDSTNLQAAINKLDGEIMFYSPVYYLISDETVGNLGLY